MRGITIVKLVLPLIIMVALLSSFILVYKIDSEEIVTGKSEISLSYRFYLTNEGPLNLSSLSFRIALLKSWDLSQEVSDREVLLQPNRTTTDVYENEFAWYEFDNFAVGQTLDVTINVNLTLNFMDFTSVLGGNTPYDTSDPLYKLYTAYDSLTDTSDPKIQEVASRFKSDKNDISALAFEAYNFSSTFLNYKLLSESKGASFAIANGYGDCDEYMNLFIALVRSIGIPAIGHTAWLIPEIAPGLVTSDQGAAAHAYPMFLHPELGLISADPTRGKDQLYDNWAKTDEKRITLTRGPDNPYRLLNYKWIPVEGFDNPVVTSNYTISIFDLVNTYSSSMRFLVLGEIIVLPMIFIIFSILNAKREKRKHDEVVYQLLNPEV